MLPVDNANNDVINSESIPPPIDGLLVPLIVKQRSGVSDRHRKEIKNLNGSFSLQLGGVATCLKLFTQIVRFAFGQEKKEL